MTRHRAFPVAALVCIYALAVVVYSLIGAAHRFPNLFPDEMLYGKLAQGLAFGHGLEWRGSGWGLPPLWPVVMSVGWQFGSVPEGYAAAKVIGALLAPLVVVPTWLLARDIVGSRLALVPALLTIAGSWMCVTSYLVSENLAFPLATGSLACTVMALRDTRSRWVAASAALALLAALTRTQMLALGVILLLALVLDVIRQPRGTWRARIAARPLAIWIALALVVAGGLLLFVVMPGLTNYDVLAHHASISDIAATTGRHAVSAIVMLAFVPVVATVALMLRASNWRDDRIGPLLVTIVATILVLFPLLGRFEAWATSGSPVERYAMYLAPLMLTALVAAPGRISRPAALTGAVVVVAALFAAPITRNYLEQPALYGMQKRLFELSPYARDHLQASLVLAAIPIAALGALALSAPRRYAAVGLAFAAAVTGALTVMQMTTSQHAEIALERQVRARVLPSELDWVDRRAHGPVALLAIDDPQPLRGNSDLYTDFFNRKVGKLLSTAPAPGACSVLFSGGVLDGACGEWPREYVLTPGSSRVTFRGQVVVARTVRGTLLRLPAGRPRLSSR